MAIILKTGITTTPEAHFTGAVLIWNIHHIYTCAKMYFASNNTVPTAFLEPIKHVSEHANMVDS